MSRLGNLLRQRARFVWDMEHGHADPRDESRPILSAELSSLHSGLCELEKEIADERLAEAKRRRSMR